eukprot:jgi/Chrzof1/7432/Cz02g23140.t1
MCVLSLEMRYALESSYAGLTTGCSVLEARCLPQCQGSSTLQNALFQQSSLRISWLWLRCSCHEGQPSRIRDLLHHAIVVALHPASKPNTNTAKFKQSHNQESPRSSNKP